MLKEKGLLAQSEQLLFKVRAYYEERFDFMDKHNVLKYLEFFKEIGMLFHDKDLMTRLSLQIQRNFYEYEIPELF